MDRLSRVFRLSLSILAVGATLHAAHPTAVSLLSPALDLGGDQQSTVVWTELSSINSALVPASGAGALSVQAPGGKYSSGFYSFSGDYSATVASAPVSFAIKNVVLQIVGMTVSGETAEGQVVDYTPEDHMTFNGGPMLAYTLVGGGSGTLASTSHGTRGGPVSGSGGGFDGDYYTFAWQWDLSGLPGEIASVSILAPLRVHSSTIGVRLDLGDIYEQVVGEPALTLLEQWRLEKFLSADNSGDGADSADPDGDGLPNLLEYALGREPWTADSARATTVSLNAAGTRLVLGFDRIADSALTYVVEAKDDLAAAEWTDITPASLAAAPAGPATVEDSQDLSASPRRFLRLRVEAN